jgi:hypothetical protein
MCSKAQRQIYNWVTNVYLPVNVHRCTKFNGANSVEVISCKKANDHLKKKVESTAVALPGFPRPLVPVTSPADGGSWHPLVDCLIRPKSP